MLGGERTETGDSCFGFPGRADMQVHREKLQHSFAINTAFKYEIPAYFYGNCIHFKGDISDAYITRSWAPHIYEFIPRSGAVV